MQSMRKLFILMFLLTGLSALQACDSNDGPLEEAGEEIDEAAANAADGIEEACEDVTGNDCD